MMELRENRFERLTDKERQVALEFLRRLRQRFTSQLLAAVLFGSRARGEAKPDSDMDVLVVMSRAGPEVRKAIRHLAVELWLEHDIYLSTRIYSQTRWHKLEELQTLLYRNIQRDGIQLPDPFPATVDST
jgi:predicted nucleotidyltransferase